MDTTVHTIGHSDHTLERFLCLLRDHGVVTLVDVRSQPCSRHVPHFTKGQLSQALAAVGIEYVYLGKELGGRPGGEFVDERRKVDYARRALDPGFVSGLDRLAGMARSGPTAIMCAEDDPRRCHRRLLITPGLMQRDLTVLHIRSDGRVEPEGTIGGTASQMPLF